MSEDFEKADKHARSASALALRAVPKTAWVAGAVHTERLLRPHNLHGKQKGKGREGVCISEGTERWETE